MSENVLHTVQQLVQDVIAPDVRELKVRVSSLEKQMDGASTRWTSALLSWISVLRRWTRRAMPSFTALMAAISESKAQAELTNMRLIAALSERVAVLEAKRQ